MGLQEAEVNVRVVSASALADIGKHSEDTAQAVLDAGAVCHLVRATNNTDTRLKVCICLTDFMNSMNQNDRRPIL